MNYRVGLYGCKFYRTKTISVRLNRSLSVPPGQAAADAGALNLGFKDQRLALEWIQNNIHHFGGDPDKASTFPQTR